jgi:hypothetical protein
MPQQRERGPPVHLALEQFQAIDLPLGLAITPGQFQPGTDRCPIAAQADCETAQLGQITPLRQPNPWFESVSNFYMDWFVP